MRKYFLLLLTLFWCSHSLQELKAEESLIHQQLNEARHKMQLPVEIHQERNAKGEITHLGVALFNQQHQQVLNPYLWRGCERMMLELFVKANDNERMTWLRERNVRLFFEATQFGTPGFTSFSRVVPVLKQITSIKLNEEADRYRLLITGGNDESTIRLSFPKERELIFGTDKKEEDQRQGELLSKFQGAMRPATLPSAEDLAETDHPGIFHTHGQALYIDSLRTDSYYQLRAGKPVPVYSSAHPRESLCNLMLGKIRRQELSVHVTHRQYGNAVIEWNTSLENLLAALSSEEVMESYAAVQVSSREKKLTGILILRNIAFGYNNMLMLSMPMEQLDSQEPAQLEAMLYTNIPQHNILSLFEERTHVRKGQNPQQKFNHPISK